MTYQQALMYKKAAKEQALLDSKKKTKLSGYKRTGKQYSLKDLLSKLRLHIKA